MAAIGLKEILVIGVVVLLLFGTTIQPNHRRLKRIPSAIHRDQSPAYAINANPRYVGGYNFTFCENSLNCFANSSPPCISINFCP